MGIMSRLAAEHAATHKLTERMDMLEARAEDDRDRIDALRRELRIASFRFEALAGQTEPGPLRALYAPVGARSLRNRGELLMKIHAELQPDGEWRALDLDEYEAESDVTGWWSCSLVGYGKTEQEAKDDLLAEIELRAHEAERRHYA